MIITTVSSKIEADKLANGLLNNRLAACINVIENIKSYYWWKQSIQIDNELILFIKTDPKLENSVIKFIEENHSYDIPAIYSINSTENIHIPYLNWILKETNEINE